MQGCSVGRLEIFEVSPDHVIGLARGKALGKLTLMVRQEFPLCFLILGATDFHSHAVDGAIVWSPNSSKDKCVRLAWFGLLLRVGDVQREAGEEQYGGQVGKKCQGAGKRKALRKNHRLRFPPRLRPRLPRILLPRLSVRGDWWSPPRSRCRTQGRTRLRLRPLHLPRSRDWSRIPDTEP